MTIARSGKQEEVNIFVNETISHDIDLDSGIIYMRNSIKKILPLTISFLAEVKFRGNIYYLNCQTNKTFDYWAVNFILGAMYEDDDDYLDLRRMFDNDREIEELLSNIVQQSKI